jgi:hypothetical protein
MEKIQKNPKSTLRKFNTQLGAPLKNLVLKGKLTRTKKVQLPVAQTQQTNQPQQTIAYFINNNTYLIGQRDSGITYIQNGEIVRKDPLFGIPLYLTFRSSSHSAALGQLLHS